MSYYEINENTARRAKEMMSFSDYQEGSATASYRAQIDSAAAELETVKRKCKTEAQRERAEHFFEKYSRVLALAINRDNEIATRCPSIMISGGSNFPVRKKEKQVAAWDTNQENFSKAEHYLSLMRSAPYTAVASDDPEAVEYLKGKLERLEKYQERMKAANAAIRMKDTEKGDARLAELGYAPDEIKKLREPDFCGRVGYPSFELTNNNATIKRVRERLEKLEKAKAAEPTEEEHDGYTYKEDAELMRVQFFFDGKPDEETRSILKANGFRWAPSHGAWQRQLTANGKYAAKRVMEALGA